LRTRSPCSPLISPRQEADERPGSAHPAHRGAAAPLVAQAAHRPSPKPLPCQSCLPLARSDNFAGLGPMSDLAAAQSPSRPAREERNGPQTARRSRHSRRPSPRVPGGGIQMVLRLSPATSAARRTGSRAQLCLAGPRRQGDRRDPAAWLATTSGRLAAKISPAAKTGRAKVPARHLRLRAILRCSGWRDR
jgi:hypothetical protein